MCYYCLYGFAPAYLFKLLRPYQLLSRSDRSANAYLPGAFCPCIRLEKLGEGVFIYRWTTLSAKNTWQIKKTINTNYAILHASSIKSIEVRRGGKK